MRILTLTIAFMQIWDVGDTFGCCPIIVPCMAYGCKPCIKVPCPPALPPPSCPPPLPCPPPPICPPPPPPVICPTLPPPCPPQIICPPPPPPVICPPLPPPCPPPPICPAPVVCPRPIICPPPSPPPPPPPPTPPHPCPPPFTLPICPIPAPKLPSTYTTPVINDCCCTCATSCVYSQMRVHGAKIFSASLSADLENDSKCNDHFLKLIMEENMVDDPTTSKRAIQRAAEARLYKKFNVICSENDFSYIAYTDTFCQHSNDDITCYAFSPLPEF